jgi:hypothetical protein
VRWAHDDFRRRLRGISAVVLSSIFKYKIVASHLSNCPNTNQAFLTWLLMAEDKQLLLVAFVALHLV